MPSAFILSVSSFTVCLPFKSQPSIILVLSATLHLSSETVFPKPLPPEVAKRTIVLPEKSALSRKVLIIVGATYHQMGKPRKITSYPAISAHSHEIAGRLLLSLISTELRDFLFVQSRSAGVYGVSGLISYISAPAASASCFAAPAVTPLAEK